VAGGRVAMRLAALRVDTAQTTWQLALHLTPLAPRARAERAGICTYPTSQWSP
jgi:hypothetical protein